jgi:hypothetical protein
MNKKPALPSYVSCVLTPGFWIGLTVGFPLEHFVWEKIPPFKFITVWLGL